VPIASLEPGDKFGEMIDCFRSEGFEPSKAVLALPTM